MTTELFESIPWYQLKKTGEHFGTFESKTIQKYSKFSFAYRLPAIRDLLDAMTIQTLGDGSHDLDRNQSHDILSRSFSAVNSFTSREFIYRVGKHPNINPDFLRRLGGLPSINNVQFIPPSWPVLELISTVADRWGRDVNITGGYAYVGVMWIARTYGSSKQGFINLSTFNGRTYTSPTEVTLTGGGRTVRKVGLYRGTNGRGFTVDTPYTGGDTADWCVFKALLFMIKVFSEDLPNTATNFYDSFPEEDKLLLVPGQTIRNFTGLLEEFE